ncbi:MAG: prenyltransferase/squalene oxidase repeat-containing protein [Planctomycetota bacterium]
MLLLLRDDIRSGLAQLPATYRDKHLRWLISRQQAEGGFANRRGNVDLYYTAFALRGLSVLQSLTPESARAAAGLLLARMRQPEALRIKQPGGAFCDAVLAASWWDALALCEEILGPQLAAEESADARQATLARLAALRRPDGGYAKTDIDASGSLYHTFLAAAVCLRLGTALPEPERALAFARSLAQPTGGFRENRHARTPGTNGSAAGVALGVLLGETGRVEEHASFLAAMQDEDGGFRATPAAPLADLLSTCTALFTLKLLGKLAGPAAERAAQFARSLEQAGGGYTGFALDSVPDCEYTFYGLASEGLAAASAT